LIFFSTNFFDTAFLLLFKTGINVREIKEKCDSFDSMNIELVLQTLFIKESLFDDSIVCSSNIFSGNGSLTLKSDSLLGSNEFRHKNMIMENMMCFSMINTSWKHMYSMIKLVKVCEPLF